MSRNTDNLLRRTQLLRLLLDCPAGATSETLAERAEFDTTSRKVGNAIVPQVAAEMIGAYMECYRHDSSTSYGGELCI